MDRRKRSQQGPAKKNERRPSGKNSEDRTRRRSGSTGKSEQRNYAARGRGSDPDEALLYAREPAERTAEMPENMLAGRNPVIEALKSGREIEKIFLIKGAEGSAVKIEGMARDRKIAVQYVQRSALDRMTAGAVHQGAAALISDFVYCEPDDILKRAADRGEDPFIIVLDGIEDPHNLGAIIRTADAAGAHGVIIPKRRAAAVTPAAEKAAAGAAAYVPVARVTNIARTVDELKEKGIWTAAADMGGSSVWDSDLTGPAALIIGNEGRGISRLVREKCDYTVSFPMMGSINSLNASNAAALLMYEVLRQRMRKPAGKQ